MDRQHVYLLWFANENVDFRLQEIKAIIKLFSIQLKWIECPNETPFWIVEFQNEEDALKLANRSVTLRSVIKLWGFGHNVGEMHTYVKNYPQDIIAATLELPFRVEVVTFGKTSTMKDKVDKIEMFSYLPARGPVKLSSPDVTLFYIEYYGLDPSSIPEQPFYFYFGLWLCNGQRSLISKYSLKTRKFIGNTSMDPQLSFIMANQALIKKGDLVIDPFVGTGSLLVAAAHFGAYVVGVDIDFLMLHGKTRPTRKQERFKSRATDESVYSNLKQYGIHSQYLDVVVGDSSLPFWHINLKLDSIICDPPYGIREAAERIGSTRDYKIKEDHLQTHIPSKVGYGLTQIFTDLLNFSVKHLKIRGRLVTWIPVYKKNYSVSNLPYHSCLQLVSNSEQTLTSLTSRRLLTWEKVREVESLDDKAVVPEMFPMGFREHYFGHGETRKQKRERIAKELKVKGVCFQPKTDKNSIDT